MSGSKKPDFDAYGLFRATHSHFSAPLRSVLNMCHWRSIRISWDYHPAFMLIFMGLSPIYEQNHVGLDLLTLAS